MKCAGKKDWGWSAVSIMLVILALAALASVQVWARSLPEHVKFESLDGKTELDGYLFLPAKKSGEKLAAVVMMHGRGGVFSSLADGKFDGSTLSKRHVFWGRHWADLGLAALLVDSFSPRGYPQGFTIHSYPSRPESVNEVTVRPLDAFGALAYLKSRIDINPDRIFLQGWSNGASATIVSLSDEVLGDLKPIPPGGFRAGIAFYPACRLHERFAGGYKPYAPLRIFSGDNDEEVSFKECNRLTEKSAKDGGDVAITIYPGATHDFDEPSHSRQSIPANEAAFADAVSKVDTLVKSWPAN